MDFVELDLPSKRKEELIDFMNGAMAMSVQRALIMAIAHLPHFTRNKSN